jgi:outer membrane protein TolC
VRKIIIFYAMRLIAIFFPLLFFGLAGAAPLTLPEAVQGALASSPQVRAAQAQVEAAQGGRTAARGMFFPELSLTGKVTRMNGDLAMDIVVPPLTVMPGVPPLNLTLPPIQIQDKLFFNAAAIVKWPVFTGGRLWSAYKAADGAVAAQEANLALVRSQAALEAETRFFTVALTRQLDSLSSQTVLSLRAHAEEARKLQDAGQIARAEALRAQVALAEAERGAAEARENLSLARLALAEATAKDTTFDPVFDLSRLPALPRTLEEYQALAVQNHPGMRRLALEEERAGRAVSAARGEWLPAVALFGKRELYTRDLTILEPEWAVGAQVEWQLFAGGGTVGKAQQARSVRRSVEAQKNGTAQDLKLLVEKLWRQMLHAQESLASLAATEALAQESLRAQSLAFENGFATGLDVQDAELALQRLRMAKAKSAFDAWCAYAQLVAATGETL